MESIGLTSRPTMWVPIPPVLVSRGGRSGLENEVVRTS